MSNKVQNIEVKHNIQTDIEHKIPEKCGIIMPISSMDDYSESHWKDIKKILESAIQSAGFEARIVSESDDIGVIHQRIVQNLYDNPMIVCDISGKNPNVMFELGLRLAFDKPTIIVKDDATQYSFDTSVIEHLTYPKDLRHQKIEIFKFELKDKIEKTYQTFLEDPSKYSTFLKNFGSFKVPEIEEKVVPINEYIIEELKSIRGNLDQLNLRSRSSREVLSRKNINTNASAPTIQEAHISFYTTELLKKAELKFSRMEQVIAIRMSDMMLKIAFVHPVEVEKVESLLYEADITLDSFRISKGIGYFDTVPF